MEWRAPAFSLRQVVGDDGLSYTTLEAPGWIHTAEPGQPQLPFASALAVVPPTGDVTFHVRALERARRPLSHPVVPARTPVPVGSPPTDVAWTWARDERTYTGNGLYPADVITLEEAGWMHGYRLMRLTFHPLRFDPVGNVLEVTSRVHVELHFQAQAFGVAEEQAVGEGGWDRDDLFGLVLQHTVINPAQVTRFARVERPAPAPPSPTSLSGTPGETAPARTLADPPAGTQYLIIAHSKFITTVAPLAAHRAASDGLRVFSTTVEAVYNAYSGGHENPLAIRDYISHTYHSAVTPVLKYVLLVGDGTTDPSSNNQYIPPYLIPDPWQPGGRAACDNCFVMVDGSDNLADVFIGRLPVNTVEEATIVVNKILAYELNPPQWPWNKRVLFLAGNEWDGQAWEYFHDYSDQVYATLPITYSRQRVYFCVDPDEDDDSYKCDKPYEYNDISVAHDVLIRELNAGGLLASYVGHSSWQQWAVDPQPPGRMFHLDDVPSLHNGRALPVVLEMTCYTSDFSYKSGNTLDESLLRYAVGGAVATWGPTTWGNSYGHTILHTGFFKAVFQDGITRLGLAVEAAQANPDLDGLGCYLCSNLRDTYVLLGDPAMDLNLNIVPWTHAVFLPVTLRGYY